MMQFQFKNTGMIICFSFTIEAQLVEEQCTDISVHTHFLTQEPTTGRATYHVFKESWSTNASSSNVMDLTYQDHQISITLPRLPLNHNFFIIFLTFSFLIVHIM